MTECGSCHCQTPDHVAINNDGLCNDCIAVLDKKRLHDIARNLAEAAPVYLLRKPDIKNG
jgi:hypothetical protein